MKTEEERRIYYQNIIYQVCNILDNYFDGDTVCGTIDEPSVHVQMRVALLIERLKAYETPEQ